VRPHGAITLAEFSMSQRDASWRPPRCYQAISFVCADPVNRPSSRNPTG
jgi:hypothetical protein